MIKSPTEIEYDRYTRELAMRRRYAPNQPLWKRVANLGDINPIEYGGLFVYVDRRGKYPAELEILLAPEGDVREWYIYRFPLDPCTFIDGILSDNHFHPGKSAWFAPSAAERLARPQDSHIGQVVASSDYPGGELGIYADLCSADPVTRARAYIAIGEYYGWENFDHYPRVYAKRSELPRRIRRIGR